MKGTWKLCWFAMVAGLAAACSAAPDSPTSPSTTMASGLAAAADGSTLKVTAPVPESPASGTTVGPRPSFSFGGSNSTSGVGDVALNYRVEVLNEDGSVVSDSYGGSSPLQLGGDLESGHGYLWRVRAEHPEGAVGPWSGTVPFRTQNAPAPVATVPEFAGSGDPARWSTEDWRAFFMALAAQKGLPTVSNDGMWLMRPDLNARGADFQNAWRGDIRPRLFLPVPNCPPANYPGAPSCSYTRTIDLGNYGGAWQWIVR